MCIWHDWRYDTFDMLVDSNEGEKVSNLIYRTCYHCFESQLWGQHTSEWMEWIPPQPETFLRFEEVYQSLISDFQSQGLNLSVSLNDKNDSLIVYFDDRILCKIDRRISKTKDQTRHLWVFSHLNVTPSHELEWTPFRYTYQVYMSNWREIIKQRMLVK